MHTSTSRKDTGSSPLSPERVAELRAIVERHGERVALERLPGLTRTTLYRAMASLPLYGGSHMIIDAALACARSRAT